MGILNSILWPRLATSLNHQGCTGGGWLFEACPDWDSTRATATIIIIIRYLRFTWVTSPKPSKTMVLCTRSTPLKNMKVSCDDEIPNSVEQLKSCSKPPTRRDLMMNFRLRLSLIVYKKSSCVAYDSKISRYPGMECSTAIETAASAARWRGLSPENLENWLTPGCWNYPIPSGNQIWQWKIH